MEPEILIPSLLRGKKTPARLLLKYNVNGKALSENEYELLLAQKKWSQGWAGGSAPRSATGAAGNKRIALVDYGKIRPAVEDPQIPFACAASAMEAIKLQQAGYG